MTELVQQEEISAETPLGKFRARGSDILGVGQLVMLCLIGYGGYIHVVDAKEDNREQINAIKANTQAQRDQVAEMRVSNCLAALSMEQRKDQRLLDFCKSLSGGR